MPGKTAISLVTSLWSRRPSRSRNRDPHPTASFETEHIPDSSRPRFSDASCSDGWQGRAARLETSSVHRRSPSPSASTRPSKRRSLLSKLSLVRTAFRPKPSRTAAVQHAQPNAVDATDPPSPTYSEPERTTTASDPTPAPSRASTESHTEPDEDDAVIATYTRVSFSSSRARRIRPRSAPTALDVFGRTSHDESRPVLRGRTPSLEAVFHLYASLASSRRMRTAGCLVVGFR